MPGSCYLLCGDFTRLRFELRDERVRIAERFREVHQVVERKRAGVVPLVVVVAVASADRDVVHDAVRDRILPDRRPHVAVTDLVNRSIRAPGRGRG